MAVRPKRTSPVSTRPVYLPRVSAKDLQAAKAPATAASDVRLFTDAATVPPDVAALADDLNRLLGRPVSDQGSVLTLLVGRPQGEVRQAVALLGNALAWARIRDGSKREYRVLPLRSEVDAEEAFYLARSQPAYEGVAHPSPGAGALYDATAAQAAFAEALALGPTDVLITSRRIAAWDEGASAWKQIALAAGPPVLVSLSSGPDAQSLAAEVAAALAQ